MHGAEGMVPHGSGEVGEAVSGGAGFQVSGPLWQAAQPFRDKRFFAGPRRTRREVVAEAGAPACSADTPAGRSSHWRRGRG